MEGPYRVINSVIAHDGGPIRSIALGPNEGELVTGCQSDAPSLKRWKISDDYTSMTEIGSAIYHDHWVTALTVLPKDPSRSFYPQVITHSSKSCGPSFIQMSPSLCCISRVVLFLVVWIIIFVSLILIHQN